MVEMSYIMININIIYKLLSILLMYPDSDFKLSLEKIMHDFINERILSKKSHDDIICFLNYLIKEDLLFLQQSYVDIFDRKKIYSLYLFEHIHGDSKDRGQAMVDLQNMYISNGYKMNSYELPDYLPVFLEYLSLISEKDSTYLLGEVVNIIVVIGSRLKEINSLYNTLFFALEELSSVKSDENIIKLALSYKENTILNEEFENEWTESIFHYDKKIGNNY